MTITAEIDALYLDAFGIPRDDHFVAAYTNSADAITVVEHDIYGADSIDPPNVDESGEDAWEWIDFDNGHQRDVVWLEDNELTDRDVLIERYEHSLVRYAPIGESSQIDRQWDVAQGVAVIRFTKPQDVGGGGVTLLDVARNICDEYTAWCNGDTYTLTVYRRRPPIDAPHSPVLIPDEYTEDTWIEDETVGGFLGYEDAVESAERGDWW